MLKKRIASFAVVVIVAFSSAPGAALAGETGVYQPDLAIQAKSAIVVEPTTGKILYELNPDERLPLASVTKVMTILLIYDAIRQEKIKWDDEVSVSAHAASMGGSQIFLEEGERQSVRDLTKSIIIASANDAAVTMAEFVAGSEESFVSLMNKKAGELGMTNSSFKNACGLDTDGHFSSARDIAIATREIMNNYPEAFEFAKVWQDSITHKTARGESEFGLTNTNKLIKQYSGATGFKTGSTSKALYCLSGTAERGGLRLISVILGAPDPKVRFQEVMKMFDYGFANYKLAEGFPAGSPIAKISVSKGKKTETDVIVKELVGTVITKGAAEALASEIHVDGEVKAPADAGTRVGEIVYSYNNEIVGKSDLVIGEGLEAASFADVAGRLKTLWFK